MFMPSEDNPGTLTPTNPTITFFIGIAFAATIGGIGSLMGTPTNLVTKGIYEA